MIGCSLTNRPANGTFDKRRAYPHVAEVITRCGSGSYSMPYLAKRKRSERAHRYKVLAQQLDFHLTAEMDPKVKECVESAKHFLLEAATLLEADDTSRARVGQS